MSLSTDILDALGASAEAMSTRELVDALDLERGQKSTVAVSSALSHHVSRGKVVRLAVPGGYRYLLAPAGHRPDAEPAPKTGASKAAAMAAGDAVLVSRAALATVLRTAKFAFFDADDRLLEAIRELRAAAGPEATHG